MRRIIVVLSVLVGTLTMGLVTVPVSVAGAVTPTTTIYDSTDPSSPALVSQPFEAQQATEVGNQIQFAPGTSRTLNNVTVTMETYACGTSGGWSTGDCVTAPGATFAQPITLNLYNVNPDNSVGSLITSVTQTVDLAYRPSADPTHCTGADAGKWWDGTSCDNSMATDATLSLGDVTVPDKVIYGVEIRTSNYGDPAIGGPMGTQACDSTSNGCPYDSLNVALTLDPDNVSVGSDPLGNGIYWNTATAGWYCDGGSSAVGTFRFDGGCWGENSPYTAPPYYVPAVQFNAESTCTTVCYVNAASGNDTNAGTLDSPFATIQHAVTTVSSGGTVHVAAGTYDENVSITQPVTLLGANATIPATGTGRGAESVISTSNTSGNDISVDVAAPGVTVDGFTIHQTAAVTCATCAAFGVGVEPSASGATVADNVITGMTTTGTQGQLGGTPGNAIGINVGANSTTSPNGVTLARNLISGIATLGTEHKSALGIEVGDSGSHPTGTGLVVAANHVTGVSSVGWGGYGIILNRPTIGSAIVGNTFDTIYGGGWARGVGLESVETSPVVENNAISGVSAPNPSSGSANDVYVDGSDTGAASSTISDNLLAGTSTVGVANAYTSATVAAPTNSWGCAGGSGTAGCSVTGGLVTATPWIVSSTPDPAKAGQPGFWPTAITSSAAPAIHSASSVVFNLGQPGTFTVSASATPAPTLSVTGTLPTGVTFDPTTGILAGTPTQSGAFPLTVTAHNGAYANATQPFTLTVSSNTAGITSASSIGIAQGKKVRFTVTTSGSPAATVSATGLPSWMTLTPGTGSKAGTAKLSGKGPVGGGTFSFTLDATNGFGPPTTQVFTVHVLAVSSAASVNFSRSGPPTQSFTVTATGATSTPTFSATFGGAQSGLSFHDNGNGTATISGVPTASAHTRLVTVHVTSGSATTSQKLAIGITN